MRALLGPDEYARATDFQTFLYGKVTQAVRNDIARLEGARFVSASEAKREEKFDEVLIKQITGRDTIAAHFLYREFTEFKPQFKIFLAANHGPKIIVGDDAFWNRVHVVPFNVRIPKSRQDKTLGDKLKRELPGILAWAVKGCLNWQKKKGLHPPAKVQEALGSYKRDADVVWAFIQDRCYDFRHLHDTRRGFSRSYAITSDVWNEWTEWCNENGVEKGSQKAFWTALVQKGFDRGKKYVERRRDGELTKEQVRVYYRLMLISQMDKDLDEAMEDSYKTKDRH